MIYLFTALYCEAHIFISRYHLVKNPDRTRFQEFYNEEEGIRLAVTGVGEIAAAATVASVCSVYGPKEGDLLLHVGTCARSGEIQDDSERRECLKRQNDSEGRECPEKTEIGEIFLCNKITEQTTGKTFYPDMLYRHSFCEEAIVTGMTPLNIGNDRNVQSTVIQENEESAEVSQTVKRGKSGMTEVSVVNAGEEKIESRKKDDVTKLSPVIKTQNDMTEVSCALSGGKLYDMESAAIYQAGSRFFGPHQMVFLKVVSDSGTAGEVSPKQVEQLMEAGQARIFDYIGQLRLAAVENGCGNSCFRKDEEALLEKLCIDLHCSKAMGDSLRQYIRYFKLAGTDYVSLIQDMYEKGLLPCKDKKEGKLRFEELKRKLC